MGIAESGPGVELLEDLLRDQGNSRPALRIRALRRRLLVGLRATELAAGALGGAVLGIIAGADPLGTLIAIVTFAIVWRFLGTVSGICVDDDARPWTSTLRTAKTTLLIALAMSWIAIAVLSVMKAENVALAAIAAATVASATAISGRAVVQSLVYRSAELAQRTVIIGSGVVARQVVDRLKLAPHLSLETIGLVDDDVHLESSPELPRLGGLDDLEDVLHRYDVDRVIIAFTRSGHDELLRCIRVCWDNHVAIDIVPRLFEFLDGARTIDQVGGLPMLSITVPQMSGSARALKRGSDIILSGLGMLAISPILLGVAIMIKLESRGPVFFRQTRVGRNGKPFKIYKYRSMHIDAEERKREFDAINDATDGVMFKIHDDPRITRVGHFLRKFSIDELPQLINVLQGDMSLVGPRPLIGEETAAFNQGWHQRRLDLRPGMTGPWQIYGRSDIPFQDMLRFDYQYVAGWSLGRDLEIMLSTIPAMFSGRGAY